jgi:hypothetical protein
MFLPFGALLDDEHFPSRVGARVGGCRIGICVLIRVRRLKMTSAKKRFRQGSRRRTLSKAHRTDERNPRWCAGVPNGRRCRECPLLLGFGVADGSAMAGWKIQPVTCRRSLPVNSPACKRTSDSAARCLAEETTAETHQVVSSAVGRVSLGECTHLDRGRQSTGDYSGDCRYGTGGHKTNQYSCSSDDDFAHDVLRGRKTSCRSNTPLPLGAMSRWERCLVCSHYCEQFDRISNADSVVREIEVPNDYLLRS